MSVGEGDIGRRILDWLGFLIDRLRVISALGRSGGSGLARGENQLNGGFLLRRVLVCRCPTRFYSERLQFDLGHYYLVHTLLALEDDGIFGRPQTMMMLYEYAPVVLITHTGWSDRKKDRRTATGHSNRRGLILV